MAYLINGCERDDTPHGANVMLLSDKEAELIRLAVTHFRLTVGLAGIGIDTDKLWQIENSIREAGF